MQRIYTHRSFGNIGSVELVAPEGKWTLDGKELPGASVDHLVNFALQTLQDSYAGAKTADEAKADFIKKYDKLIAGTLGLRGGDGADAFTIEARSLTRAVVKASMGVKSPEWAKFTGLDDKAQLAKLDEWFAENEAEWTPKVNERLAAKAKAAADKQGLAKKVTFKL